MLRAVQLLANPGIHTQFLAKLARESLGGRFAGFDFPTGEFPLKSVGVIAVPLADQESGISDDESCRNR
jgi:hypothetical protein